MDSGGFFPKGMNGTGVSSYWFMTESNILSFFGGGSWQVEQGPNIVVQAIEKVILAAATAAPNEERSCCLL